VFDVLIFGDRLFAQNCWWIKVLYFRDGFYLAIKSNDRIPAKTYIVHQSKEDAKYQEILFRNFKRRCSRWLNWV